MPIFPFNLFALAIRLSAISSSGLKNIARRFFFMNPAESKTNILIFGDNPSVAIVTLWTPVEMVASRLSKKDFGIIGNLYNAERGLDALIRSLLSDPQIKHLVITGSDMGKSGQVLRDFFENGFTKGKTRDTGIDCWRINSKFEGCLGLDIPQTALEELRTSVRVYLWDFTQPFQTIRFESPLHNRKKQVFEKKTVFVKKYFSEPAAFIFRSTGFLEAWFLSLDSLLKLGRKDNKKKKLFHVVFTFLLNSEKPLLLPDFLPFSADDCDVLANQWVHELSISSLSSCFGKKMPFIGTLSFFGAKIEVRLQDSGGLLEVQAIVPSSDAWACANFLAALQQLFEKNPPIGFPSEKISITVSVLEYFILQEEIAGAIELVSANYLKTVTPARLLRDWRGNFVIYISQGEIVVEHVSPGNELLYMYTGKTALELRDQLLFENLIGTIAHAIYLGAELQKAEIALKLGLPYVQDKPLNFSKN
jgi:thymidylate synthase